MGVPRCNCHLGGRLVVFRSPAGITAVCVSVYSARQQIRRLRQTVGWFYRHRRRPSRLRVHASLTVHPRHWSAANPPHSAFHSHLPPPLHPPPLTPPYPLLSRGGFTMPGGDEGAGNGGQNSSLAANELLIRAANGAVPAVWPEISKSSADHRPVATDFTVYRLIMGCTAANAS